MSPDDQIQIQLVVVPMYGILTKSQSQQEHQELREYSSFTMEDINKHRIRWVDSRNPVCNRTNTSRKIVALLCNILLSIKGRKLQK